MQAVDHVDGSGVQAVGALQIAFADDPGGVDLHFICDIQLFRLASTSCSPAANKDAKTRERVQK